MLNSVMRLALTTAETVVRRVHTEAMQGPSFFVLQETIYHDSVT